MRELRLATRRAEGPISTPRRPWPRSRGAPMMEMWVRGMGQKNSDAETQRHREDRILCFSVSLCLCVKSNASEFGITRGSRERDYVADVFHAGEVHYHALETHAEAGVLDAAESAEIEIPPVVFLFHAAVGIVPD